MVHGAVRASRPFAHIGEQPPYDPDGHGHRSDDRHDYCNSQIHDILLGQSLHVIAAAIQGLQT
jgi:hypothetical protein